MFGAFAIQLFGVRFGKTAVANGAGEGGIVSVAAFWFVQFFDDLDAVKGRKGSGLIDLNNGCVGPKKRPDPNGTGSSLSRYVPE